MPSKNLFLLFLLAITFNCSAQTLSNLEWKKVCSGGMSDSWYGSEEAKKIADRVVYLQKENGGWDKNLEIHKMSQTELDKAKSSPEHGKQSCLDNNATTQEMRFLAKVYHKTSVVEYKTAFNKALTMIFKAEKSRGGWSQYWPLTGNRKYHDYITFNDDLTVNVLKLLRDIGNNTGDFQGIAEDASRERCIKDFNKTIDMIIACQYDDNGVKSAWCAQHDTIDLLPTEGRPHELPSISGCESAHLLSFLMTIDNPSDELKQCIISAVEWLNNHKYLEGKTVEKFKNSNGQDDMRIVNKAGSDIWARFIQLGGESGKKVYEKFFKTLKDINKSRSYTDASGTTYKYSEYELASKSYDETKAYQPIYSIYDDKQLPHLFYRFLYIYEDAAPTQDWKGCTVPTSLDATRRTKYDYLGTWCTKLINEEYPKWKNRVGVSNLDAINSDNNNDSRYYRLDGTMANSSDGNINNIPNGTYIHRGKIIIKK